MTQSGKTIEIYFLRFLEFATNQTGSNKDWHIPVCLMVHEKICTFTSIYIHTRGKVKSKEKITPKVTLVALKKMSDVNNMNLFSTPFSFF
jgi:hypothetical protein